MLTATWSPEDVKFIRDNYSELGTKCADIIGKTPSKIAEMAGMAQSSVYKIIKDAGEDLKSRGILGSKT